MRQANANDLEHFNTKGYILLKEFFPKEKASQAAEWLRQQDPKKMVRSWMDTEPQVELAVWQNIHKGEDPVGEIAGDPRVLEYASSIMNDKVYVWSSKVNLKAAWCGTAEYHHQDYVYWKDRGYDKMDMLSCMIFLDKHGVDNAGLNVLPGSHRNGYIEHVPFININGLSKFMVPPKTLDSVYNETGVEVIEAEPGDVLFFHAGLIHGSAHNISPNPRMVAIAQLNTERNKPENTTELAKQFNLSRAKREIDEAQRKYELLKEKYETEYNSKELVFNSPVQEEENEE